MASWARACLIGAVCGLATSLVVLGLEAVGVNEPLGPQPGLLIALVSAIVVAADLLRHRSD